MSSAQNFRRSPEEVEAFCKAEAMGCRRFFPDLIRQFKVRVRIAGRVEILPHYLRETLLALNSDTETNEGRRLYLCVAYDPFDEIEHAIQKRVGNDCLANSFWVPEPIDLVIRTGGANVISNFLPLQTAFARLFFLAKLFNDVTTNDLRQVLNEFRGHTRLYGE
jgi:undecaprenyl diphosphate synthase